MSHVNRLLSAELMHGTRQAQGLNTKAKSIKGCPFGTPHLFDMRVVCECHVVQAAVKACKSDKEPRAVAGMRVSTVFALFDLSSIARVNDIQTPKSRT